MRVCGDDDDKPSLVYSAAALMLWRPRGLGVRLWSSLHIIGCVWRPKRTLWPVHASQEHSKESKLDFLWQVDTQGGRGRAHLPWDLKWKKAQKHVQTQQLSANFLSLSFGVLSLTWNHSVMS